MLREIWIVSTPTLVAAWASACGYCAATFRDRRERWVLAALVVIGAALLKNVVQSLNDVPWPSHQFWQFVVAATSVLGAIFGFQTVRLRTSPSLSWRLVSALISVAWGCVVIVSTLILWLLALSNWDVRLFT